MNRSWIVVLAVASSVAVMQRSAAPALAQQSGVTEIKYRSVADFLKLPADLYSGEVAGVAMNSKRHVFVFSRGNTTGPAYAASAGALRGTRNAK